MKEFSLGDWKEDSVGVFSDGKLVARLVNTDQKTQPHLDQELLDCIRFGASRLAALRQCRARLGEWVDAGSTDDADHAACVAADQVFRRALLCSICNKEIPIKEGGWDSGNSAQPVSDGRCCDECDMSVVIPARLQLAEWTRRKQEEREDGE